MKNLLALVVTITVAYYTTKLDAWYMIAVAGFIGGLITRKPLAGFVVTFIGVGGLWFVQLWMITEASPSDLPDRIGALIGVGSGLTLQIVSSLIGGFVAGCAGVAGGILFQKKKKRRRY